MYVFRIVWVRTVPFNMMCRQISLFYKRVISSDPVVNRLAGIVLPIQQPWDNVALSTAIFSCKLLQETEILNPFCCRMILGRLIFLNVFDVDFLKAVTIKEFPSFMNRRSVTDYEGEFLNSQIFSTRDDHWKNVRSLLTPTFTSGKLKAVSGWRKLSFMFNDLQYYLLDLAWCFGLADVA